MLLLVLLLFLLVFPLFVSIILCLVYAIRLLGRVSEISSADMVTEFVELTLIDRKSVV